ncbi:MAG: tetratricopeptide repeat protein, partial [Myxococcota bacterium]
MIRPNRSGRLSRAIAVLAALSLFAAVGCESLRARPGFLGGGAEDKPRTIVLADEDARAGFHFSIGQLALAEGDIAEAAREFELASVYDPDSPEIRLTLATLLVSTGDLDKALVHLQKCVALDPGNARARTLLAGI